MYRREVRRIVYPTKENVQPVDLAKAHAATRFKALRPRMRDASYVGVSMEAWRRINKYDLTDVKGCSRDVFDCDDFALIFKAHCVEWFGVTGIGVVIDDSSRHAYNLLLVCDEGEKNECGDVRTADRPGDHGSGRDAQRRERLHHFFKEGRSMKKRTTQALQARRSR